MKVRNYEEIDYEAVKQLYLKSSIFGGQFDEARDSFDKLYAIVKHDAQSILVCEAENRVIGTISLIENPRVAWLYRFAANSRDVERILFDTACGILKERGHTQVLVYSPSKNFDLNKRYENLGMNKGNDYSCFWKEL